MIYQIEPAAPLWIRLSSNGRTEILLPDQLMLKTPGQIEFATQSASTYEINNPSLPKLRSLFLARDNFRSKNPRVSAAYEAGDWALSAAHRLFDRILAAQKALPARDPAAEAKTRANLDRVATFQLAAKAQTDKDYKKALPNYAKFVAAVTTSPTLDLKAKYALLGNALDNISPEFVTKEPSAKKLEADITAQRSSYKKSMQCLGMAEDLNHTAGRLETQEKWDLATKLYKEELTIGALQAWECRNLIDSPTV